MGQTVCYYSDVNPGKHDVMYHLAPFDQNDKQAPPFLRHCARTLNLPPHWRIELPVIDSFKLQSAVNTRKLRQHQQLNRKYVIMLST